MEFIESELSTRLAPGLAGQTPDKQVQTMMDCLNRPIRVCGMVRNIGEPAAAPSGSARPTAAPARRSSSRPR